MGAKKSKFIAETDKNVPYWGGPNQPPNIAVYDNVNLGFERLNGTNDWIFDLNAVKSLFTGFNIKYLENIDDFEDIDYQQIIVKDNFVYKNKIDWSIGDDAYSYGKYVTAFYFRNKINMTGGNLLIDADLINITNNGNIAGSQPPINTAKIEVVPYRCVILRGDIRHKIENWRRTYDQGPGSQEWFTITVKI